MSPAETMAMNMRQVKAAFVAMAAVLVALVSGAAVAGTVTYFHADIAGSPVVASNAAGAVVWRESYRPYGERTVNSAAALDNTVWFTSRRQDPDTGLVYMGARYYDPVIGRFVSTDPAGFDEKSVHRFNRYAYANNNPYKFRDPDGRAGVLIAAEAVVMIGGLAFVSQPRETQERQVAALVQGIRSLLIWAESKEEGGKAAPGKGDESKARPDAQEPPAGKGKERDVPNRGEPGEVREGQRRTREYGPDGRPLRDYDKPHQGHQTPHVHEWENGVREHPGRDYSPLPRQGD
jgi:RHS repeat-associated protein